MKKISLRKYSKKLSGMVRGKGRVFILYSVLRVLVLLTAIRCAMTGRYESVGTCFLVLVLFLLPSFAEDTFKVRIPPAFSAVIYVFIYAAEIMGEVENIYEIIPFWDTALHTINGFLCAAVGFSMVYLLNRSSKNVNLSPFYQALVGFCFSMTIGVLWEFWEFVMERVLVAHDTQRDNLVGSFVSFFLDAEHTGRPYPVRDIVRTTIETAGGAPIVIEGGYLDIGLADTIKDMFVNFIGALVFSVYGYIYLKTSRHEKLIARLMLKPAGEGSASAPQGEAVRAG